MPDQPTEPDGSVAYGPGTVLDGRYEITSLLGRGGMAAVWRAHDRVLARDVAIKAFAATDVAGTWADGAAAAHSARATAEVRLLAGLSHPNIVAVFDASGATDSTFDHLVMEFVDGRTLRAQLDDGPMAPADVAHLGAELAAGLDYVHARGIVHRDIKPANVLLERTGGHAKIADFGIARLHESAPITMIGTTVGTANYVSPEQATGSDVTVASDVYSLGLVLLEGLTGQLAYPGSGVAAAAARLHRPPGIPAHLDVRWQTLLTAMTALDPTARPAAGFVAVRLRELAAAERAATTTLPAADRPTTALAPAGAAALPLAGTAARPLTGTATLPAALSPAGLSAGRSATATATLPGAPPRRRRRGAWWAALGAAGLVLAIAVAVLLGAGGGSGAGAPAAPSSSSGAAAGSPSASASRTTTSPSPTARPTVTVTRRASRSTSARPAGPAEPTKKDKHPAPGGGPGAGPGNAKKP